jgi:hypothetical protein
MADDAAKRKQNEWLKRPYLDYQKYSERQKKLFEALNAAVMANDSWVISPPGDRQVRIETLQNSSLIIRLAEAGHKVRHVTTGTRNTSNGVVQTDIFELTLPR